MLILILVVVSGGAPALHTSRLALLPEHAVGVLALQSVVAVECRLTIPKHDFIVNQLCQSARMYPTLELERGQLVLLELEVEHLDGRGSLLVVGAMDVAQVGVPHGLGRGYALVGVEF